MGVFSYWTGIGIFYLVILTYKDLKNKMIVDDRKNYFMMGLSLSLISHVTRHLWYVLIAVGVVVALNIFLNKYKVIGGADVSTLTWIIYGFAVINPYNLLIFGFIFSIITLLYHGIKRLYGIKKPSPFYPVILLSFILAVYITGVY